MYMAHGVKLAVLLAHHVKLLISVSGRSRGQTYVVCTVIREHANIRSWRSIGDNMIPHKMWCLLTLLTTQIMMESLQMIDSVAVPFLLLGH